MRLPLFLPPGDIVILHIRFGDVGLAPSRGAAIPGNRGGGRSLRARRVGLVRPAMATAVTAAIDLKITSGCSAGGGSDGFHGDNGIRARDSAIDIWVPVHFEIEDEFFDSCIQMSSLFRHLDRQLEEEADFYRYGLGAG